MIAGLRLSPPGADLMDISNLTLRDLPPIRMDRATTTRTHAFAWLLCAVLACMAVYSPHCDLCDGPYLVTSSSHHPLANHPLPATPDTCNGICSCCAFRALPNAGPVLDLMNTVTAGVWPESPSPVPAPPAPIFRPPRTFVFQLVGSAPLGSGHIQTNSGRHLCIDVYSRSLARAYCCVCLRMGRLLAVNPPAIPKRPMTIETL